MGAKPPLSESAVAQLCPKCGLCCNGVLFGDVELQQGDSASELRTLGLDLQRKKKRLAFAQPCSCWDGRHCGIYEDRPVQCRAFACATLQRVQAGELDVAKALGIIRQAKRQVAAVERCLRRLGNEDSDLPLTRRYAAEMAEAIDLAGDPELLRLRSRLTREMERLMQLLDGEFRRRTADLR